MSAATSPLISVVVPCLNEEASLPELYARVKDTLSRYGEQGTEIVFIDDGSSDGTWQFISECCASDPAVIGLRLTRNFGHQFALACGVENCRGQRVLIIDADLQDPPELLHDMMTKMDEGYDVVYGHRITRKQESVFKRASAWLFYRVLNRFSDVRIPVDVGDFRLMNRKVVDALMRLPERVRFTRGMVSWLGFRQAPVDYVRTARFKGETHYSLYSMIRFATEGLVSFSPHPLRLVIWLGLLLFLIGSLIFGYALYVWLVEDRVYPVTTLIGIFLVFQSIQWVLLGVISSYLGVILRETKQRPLYLLDQRLN